MFTQMTPLSESQISGPRVVLGELKKVGVMTYDVMGLRALDYLPCRYGTSKLLFRGPKRRLDEPYVAFIGGTETYGKFVPEPFPALVETQLGVACANFGCPNAGIDVFANDPFVAGAAAEARATVVQIMGAQNMTNRFYAVHPRRNDRFVSASTLLKTIYREVDFADFHFNRHMLSRLLEVSPERFVMVRDELRSAWVARMKLILGQMRGKTILLWFAARTPDKPGEGLGDDPLFITRDMINEIAPLATEVVEVVASPAARAMGSDGMVFSEMEAMAAAEMQGPAAHAEAAKAVFDALGRMV